MPICYLETCPPSFLTARCSQHSSAPIILLFDQLDKVFTMMILPFVIQTTIHLHGEAHWAL